MKYITLLSILLLSYHSYAQNAETTRSAERLNKKWVHWFWPSPSYKTFETGKQMRKRFKARYNHAFWVVDGTCWIQSPFPWLNPSNIESIEVLGEFPKGKVYGEINPSGTILIHLKNKLK